MAGAMIFSSKDNVWREWYNPLRGLTLAKIVSMVEQGDRGALADVQWFYQAMERSDAMIATVVQRRRAALLGAHWETPADEKPSDEALAREQSAFLQETYGAVENLREAFSFLSTAVFRGFAHAEKHYGEDGTLHRLEPVEQWFWCRKGMFGEWSYNREAQPSVDQGERVDMADFVTVEAPMALDRILSVQYFRRNLAMSDWSAYLDVFGIPSTFFILPQGVSDPTKVAEYQAIVESLVKDGRGCLPNGTDVKYVTGGESGRAPFRDHIDYLDRQIVLLGTGGLLTMLTESGSGTLAGGAHSDAWKQIAEADAVLLSEAFQRCVDEPLLDEAFPGFPHEARFVLTTTPPDPMQEAMKAIAAGKTPGALPPGAAEGGEA